MLDILNSIGSILLLVSTLPQFYRAWKNRKDLKDLSLASYLGQTLACLILTIWTLLLHLYFMAMLEIGFGIYTASMVYLILKRRLAECQRQ